MIVTARAKWIIALSLSAALAGLAQQDAFLVRFSTATLVWIGLEWLLFRYYADVHVNRLVASRELRNRDGKARVLWESRSAGVVTVLRDNGRTTWLPPVRATVHDLLPTGVLASGESGRFFSLGADRLIELRYQIRAIAPGTVHFSGLRLVLHDLCGFFQAERFVGLRQDYRVLPLAMNAGAISAVRKLHNILPPPGAHTLPKSGAGTELLQIREYQPGDSLRSVAWKISARRETLMCKQFESEVPIRCRLFVDMSRSIRKGYPGPSMGASLVSLAAAVTVTLTSHRDPVGLSIFDGRETNVRPASTSRKTITRTLDELCQRLDQPVLVRGGFSERSIRACFDVLRVRYPAATEYARRSLLGWFPPRSAWMLRLHVAAAMCNHYRLHPRAMGELVSDQEVMSHFVQRFLFEHGAPFTGAEYDDRGNSLLGDGAKVEQVGQLIRQTVTRAKDNELLVVFAELTDVALDLGPLRDAIKLARAKGHRAAIVLGWPPKLPAEKSPIRFDDLLRDASGPTAESVEQQQNHRARDRLRVEFAKLGVPVAAATDDDAATLIMNQLEIVRAARAPA